MSEMNSKKIIIAVIVVSVITILAGTLYWLLFPAPSPNQTDAEKMIIRSSDMEKGRNWHDNPWLGGPYQDHPNQSCNATSDFNNWTLSVHVHLVVFNSSEDSQDCFEDVLSDMVRYNWTWENISIGERGIASIQLDHNVGICFIRGNVYVGINLDSGHSGIEVAKLMDWALSICSIQDLKIQSYQSE